MSNVQLISQSPDAERARSQEPWRWYQRLQVIIDSSPAHAFLALSVLYVAAVVCLSSFKLLWLDELITLHIARLQSAGAIWQALAHGADPNPPVTHLLVHLCRAIFGERETALRLPAMVGYWIGLLSLFLYLLRRLPATWALSGTVLSMSMAAFDYSYESRSYGIFYGLTMLAFLLWSRSFDPSSTARRRSLMLAGMTLTLAACISTNYFAVLAFVPIAAGECVRTLTRLRTVRSTKAIDVRVWVCLVLAATPLIVYRPLILHSIAQFAPYAWNKVSLDQVFDSYTEMVEMVLYPILALFALSSMTRLLASLLADVCSVCRMKMKPSWLYGFVSGATGKLRIPFHEAAGVLFLMAYPFLGYVVASIRGGMLSPRFVIPVCFGFAIAATLVAFQLFGSRPLAGLCLLCFCLAWFLCRESVVGFWYSEQKQCFYKVIDHLPEALRLIPPDAPIVIPDPLLALTFQHYAPPEMARRVVFPIDFPAIRRYRHDDSPEQNMWAGRGSLYTLPIVTAADLQQSAGQYMIIASDWNWFLNDLNDHHYEITHLPINTRAGAMGGFTPLSHGTPTFYLSSGDRSPQRAWEFSVVAFHSADNLPDAKPLQSGKAEQQTEEELER